MKRYERIIDEICVVKAIPSAIREVRSETAAKQSHRVYNLNGTPMGNNLDALPHGIYIVDGRKVVK